MEKEKTKYDAFVSGDGITVTLPVPLGSTIYYPSTSCGDFCYREPTKEQRNAMRCSMHAPCHVHLKGVLENTLRMENLAFVLGNWGTMYFPTPGEALTYGKNLVESHRREMDELGLPVDGTGTESD